MPDRIQGHLYGTMHTVLITLPDQGPRPANHSCLAGATLLKLRDILIYLVKTY